MEKQILDLLLKMNDRLEGLENDMKEVKVDLSGVKADLSEVKEEQKLLRSEMIERFDVVDIRLTSIETKVIITNRKLDSTTEQVVKNLESIEEMKYKLQ